MLRNNIRKKQGNRLNINRLAYYYCTESDEEPEKRPVNTLGEVNRLANNRLRKPSVLAI